MAKKTTTTKKAAATKAPVKKAVVKKAAAKKVTPAKEAPAKKAPAAKKAAPVKKATKVTKTPVTEIVARVDVGYGNELFIRGEGAGLSWDKGTAMQCLGVDEWVFKTDSAKTGIVFKFLINDNHWADGEDVTVPAGGKSISAPTFS